MKRLAWIVILFFLFFPLACFADDDQGQHHHEDLTATQLGTVHFPVSCAAEVQKPFERGVALLHSFWYEEAEKEFVQVANDDPSCAMAHWGVAMSLWHQLWNQRMRRSSSVDGLKFGGQRRIEARLAIASVPTSRRCTHFTATRRSMVTTLVLGLIPTR